MLIDSQPGRGTRIQIELPALRRGWRRFPDAAYVDADRPSLP